MLERLKHWLSFLRFDWYAPCKPAPRIDDGEHPSITAVEASQLAHVDQVHCPRMIDMWDEHSSCRKLLPDRLVKLNPELLQQFFF
jgi:hypothetical protein